MSTTLTRRTMLKTALSAAVVGATGMALTPEFVRADQPRMENALEALKAAQKALENAADDKGGFKVKAMRHVEMAIKQVEKGIEWDKNHTGAKERKGKKDETG